MKRRKEDTGCNWNADDVLAEGEEQILPNVPHCCHAQMACSQNGAEVSFEQRDPAVLVRQEPYIYFFPRFTKYPPHGIPRSDVWETTHERFLARSTSDRSS